MRVRSAAIAVALISCFAVFAQAASDPKDTFGMQGERLVVLVKAGGVELVLPPPTDDFTEVGDKLRTTVFELLTPSANRLLTAYAPAETLDDFKKGGASRGPAVYAMVEMLRRAEYVDCTPDAFRQVLNGFESSIGKFDKEKMAQFEQEMNLRLGTLGKKPIQVGRPEMLGGIFQKADASGFAMLMALKQGDRSVTMAAGLAVLRVNHRLLFAYLFRTYESPDTVDWIRTNLETWADAILAANQ